MSVQKSAAKHHFVPKFILRAWQDDKKFLWIYNRNNKGDISFRRGAPKSVAYIENLYTLYPEFRGSRPKADEVESTVMAKIDDNAAVVHRILLEEGVQAVDEKGRRVWAVFIASMMERSPKQLQQYKEVIPLSEIESDLRMLGPNAIDLISSGGLNLESIRNNVVMKFMVERILDPEFVELLCRMHWFVIRNEICGEHFVLGDDSLIINNGSGDGQSLYVIRIAISPDMLFVMVYDDAWLDDELIRVLAVSYNLNVIRASERYVISSRELKNSTLTKYQRALDELHRR